MGKKIKNNIAAFTSKVMKEIKKQNISKRSSNYFLLRNTILLITLAIIFVFTLYLLSLLIFIFNGNSLFGLTYFGFNGWILFIQSIPWLLVVLVILLILLLEFLSSHFSIVYKKPLLYSILTLLVITIVVSTLVSHTSLHQKAFMLSDEMRLPIAGFMYRNYTVRDNDRMHIGIVVSKDDDEIIIEKRKGEIIRVKVLDDTRLLDGIVPEIGTSIMVIGEVEGDIIEAQGIRAVLKDKTLMLKHMNKAEHHRNNSKMK